MLETFDGSVVLNESRAWVIKAPAIVLGYLIKGRERLEDIEGEERLPIVVPTAEDLQNSTLHWSEPRMSRVAFEKWLQNENADYGLAVWPFPRVRAGAFVATVITRSERLAAQIGGGPVLCYCLGDFNHPCPGGPPGGKCNKCKASIKCCG